MDLRGCYESFGGDYNEIIARLGSEALIQRLLKRFCDDTNMEKLEAAVKCGNLSDAFLYVHTLKGVALNLGFTSLARSSSALTEMLRGYENGMDPGAFCDCTAALSKVRKDHDEVRVCIAQLN